MPDTRSNQPLDEPAASSLIRRVKTFDEEAWSQLVRVYGPVVWFWIRRAGLQDADGHDIFQEVFYTVAIRIGKIRDDGSFWGWLHTVTRSKIVDHFRRKQRDPSVSGGSEVLSQLPQPWPDDTDTSPTQEADELAGLRQRVLEVVRSGFEARTWDMFWQTAILERPTRKVAQEFGVTAAGVRLAKSRVLRRLRDELRGLEP